MVTIIVLARYSSLSNSWRWHCYCDCFCLLTHCVPIGLLAYTLCTHWFCVNSLFVWHMLHVVINCYMWFSLSTGHWVLFSPCSGVARCSLISNPRTNQSGFRGWKPRTFHTTVTTWRDTHPAGGQTGTEAGWGMQADRQAGRQAGRQAAQLFLSSWLVMTFVETDAFIAVSLSAAQRWIN